MAQKNFNTWKPHSHEEAVDRFYGKGVQRFDNHHGGYLNFGLWEEGITDYVEAAENLVHYMGSMLGLNRKSRLLDVGCGMGSQDVFLHRQFGCQIDALDVTKNHVIATQERIKKWKLAKAINVHHGTATRLPFPDGTFTHILGIESPEHFKTREDFFREAHRVLKPGGVMALADYNLHRQPRNLLDRLIVEGARVLWHVPRENYDTVITYKKKLKTKGFCNISIKENGEQTIPGYFNEQLRPETIQALMKIRGPLTTLGGLVIDYAVYQAFRSGLIEYIFVRAERGV